MRFLSPPFRDASSSSFQLRRPRDFERRKVMIITQPGGGGYRRRVRTNISLRRGSKRPRNTRRIQFGFSYNTTMLRQLLISYIAFVLAASSLGCTGAREPPVVYVYRLNGKYLDELHMAEEAGETLTPPTDMFRDWPVLERRRVTDPEFAHELAAAIKTGANFDGPGADCFWPGMGVAVGEGEDQTDAVICLHCNWLYRYRPDGSEERLPLSDRGAAELKRLYQQAFPDDTRSTQQE